MDSGAQVTPLPHEHLYLGLFGVLTGVALGSALGLLPEKAVAIGLLLVAGLVLVLARPIWALSVLLLVLPLEFVDLQFASMGISPMQIAGVVTLGLFFTSMLAQGRAEVARTPLDIPLLFWIAALLLGGIGALEPSGAIKLAGMTVLFAGVYYVIIRYAKTAEEVVQLLGTLILAVDGIAVYGVVASYMFMSSGTIMQKAIFIQSEDLSVPRAASTVGNPSTLAALVLLTLPAALVLLILSESLRGKVFYFASSTVLLLSLGFTFTRGAWLGAAISLVILAFADKRARRMLVVLAVLLALLAPAVVFQRVGSSTELSRPEIAARFEFWRGAVACFKQRPLFGVGAGNYPAWFTRLRETMVFQEPPSHAHNAYLHLLAENGLLGALAYLAILATFLYHMLLGRTHGGDDRIRLLKLAIAASLIGHLVQQTTDSMVLQVPVIIVTWVLLGLGMALVRQEKQEAES